MSEELPSTFSGSLKMLGNFVALGLVLTGVEMTFHEGKWSSGGGLILLSLPILFSGPVWRLTKSILDAQAILLIEFTARKPSASVFVGALLLIGSVSLLWPDPKIPGHIQIVLLAVASAINLPLFIYIFQRLHAYRTERVPISDAAAEIHEKTQGTMARGLADALNPDATDRTRIIIDGLIGHMNPKTGNRFQFYGVIRPSKNPTPLPYDGIAQLRWIPDTNSIALGEMRDRNRIDDVTVSRSDLKAYIDWLVKLGHRDNS